MLAECRGDLAMFSLDFPHIPDIDVNIPGG